MISEKGSSSRVDIMSIYMAAFGIICVFGSFLVKSLIPVTLGSFITVVGLFLLFYLHSAHVLDESNNTLKLQTRKGIIICNASDILWAMKMVRYTFTDRFWVMVKTRGHNRSLPRYYMLQNSRSLDLIDLFRNMGIRLRNIPD